MDRAHRPTAGQLSVWPPSQHTEVIQKAGLRAGLEGMIGIWKLNFVERGNFTMAEIYYARDSWYGSGVGFAHRMKGDRKSKEIGRAIALTRAIKDSLTPEEAGQ